MFKVAGVLFPQRGGQAGGNAGRLGTLVYGRLALGAFSSGVRGLGSFGGFGDFGGFLTLGGFLSLGCVVGSGDFSGLRVLRAFRRTGCGLLGSIQRLGRVARGKVHILGSLGRFGGGLGCDPALLFGFVRFLGSLFDGLFDRLGQLRRSCVRLRGLRGDQCRRSHGGRLQLGRQRFGDDLDRVRLRFLREHFFHRSVQFPDSFDGFQCALGFQPGEGFRHFGDFLLAQLGHARFLVLHSRTRVLGQRLARQHEEIVGRRRAHGRRRGVMLAFRRGRRRGFRRTSSHRRTPARRIELGIGQATTTARAALLSATAATRTAAAPAVVMPVAVVAGAVVAARLLVEAAAMVVRRRSYGS